MAAHGLQSFLSISGLSLTQKSYIHVCSNNLLKMSTPQKNKLKKKTKFDPFGVNSINNENNENSAAYHGIYLCSCITRRPGAVFCLFKKMTQIFWCHLWQMKLMMGREKNGVPFCVPATLVDIASLWKKNPSGLYFWRSALARWSLSNC